MDHQQCLVVGTCRRGQLIEAPSDHSFDFDYCELLMQLVATGEARSAALFQALLKRVIASLYLEVLI